MRSAPWYARQLERARQSRAAARVGKVCARCGADISSRVATARYCSVACQKAYLYAERSARERRTRRPAAPKRPKAPEVTIPDLELHPLVESALMELKPYERAEIGTAMDAIGRDLVGEFVLAVVAGEDPAAAIRAARARYRRDRAALVYGLTLTTGLER